ncbi:hypothetical protein A3J41_00215 [candidate division TM6 bacterium RIFCSPHIGHO2_12_FULL_38_8]|nr:MAG: hypothetical protein A3J41_00215 [candidate division TM6 bacterium RIFCSPHIGHO2_12_FULL_38_8]
MFTLKRMIFCSTIMIMSLSMHAKQDRRSLKSPKYVLIIRHGEKSNEKGPVKFKQWNFAQAKSFAVKGWERAKALSIFFTKDPAMTKYGKIVALFAPNPTQYYQSTHPVQTLWPLSEKIHENVLLHFDLGQEKKLVRHILNQDEYFGKTVLIAYEHDHIPAIGKAFVEQTNTTQVTLPNMWPFSHTPVAESAKIYDRVWVLEFDPETGKIINFQNLPQRLMFGDATA